MINQDLKYLGLSENETKVYVSLLEIGISKVNPLSKKTVLPRTTIYGILHSLLNKGLVSYAIKSGIKHYEAVNPNRLLLREKERINKLKKIIPELLSIKNTVQEKPHIEIYEGKEGIKSIYEDFLKTKKTIYGYGNTNLLFELLEFYIPNYIKQRAKLDINFYIITEKSKTAIAMKKDDRKYKRKTRFLEELKTATAVTYLYRDKIAIVGLIKQQPIGIIIQNLSFYNSYKLIFDVMWKIAK